MKRLLHKISAVALAISMLPTINVSTVLAENSSIDLPLSIYAGTWDTSHLQGFAIDDDREYMYFSFTTKLVKTDMEGNIVGTVDGWYGHLGDLAFNDGKVYGSLEYKDQDAFYIAVFDGESIDELNTPHTDVMTTMYLDEVHNDYANELDAGEHNNAVSSNGHAYGCSGIDGVTFGKEPGSDSDEAVLMVAYGIYQNNNRDDNDYQVILQYDLDSFLEDGEIKEDVCGLLDQDNFHTNGPELGEKYFVYTGNTSYGVQNLDYDSESESYFMAVYKGSKASFPNYALFNFEASTEPVETELELGDNAQYYDDNNMNKGKVIELAKYGEEHEASGVWGSNNVGGNMSTGFDHVEGDYFYISKSGAATGGGQFGYADLYKLDRETCKFKKVKPVIPDTDDNLILHFSMDASSIDENGEIFDSAEGSHNAIAQNVAPVDGVDGTEGGALYFDGKAESGNYSRVYLPKEDMDWINDELGNQITFSYWMKPDEDPASGSWSPVIGLYGDDGRFANVAEYRSGKLNSVSLNRTNTWPVDIRTIAIAPETEEWHHVVITLDGTVTETVRGNDSQYRRIWIDGVEYKPEREAYVNDDILGDLGYFEIGGEPVKYWSDTNVRGRYRGAIDDVRIYNYRLSDSDIKELYRDETENDDSVTVYPYVQNVDIKSGNDVEFEVYNADDFDGIDELSEDEYGFSKGKIIIPAKTLETLGEGKNTLTLNFKDGRYSVSCEVEINISDTRSGFSDDFAVFDKSEPIDIALSSDNFKITDINGLSKMDYEINNGAATISKNYFMYQQPGKTTISVKTDVGTKYFDVYIIKSDGENPYPLFYYKMDESDYVGGKVHDYSGNEMDAFAENVTFDYDKDSNDSGAMSFNGYEDTNVARMYLDDASIALLNEAVDDEVSYSFWTYTDRITSNQMPIMGVFGEDGRYSAVVQYRTTGGERPGVGQKAKLALFDTPEGDKNHSSNFAESSDNLDMRIWRHIVVSVSQNDGAKLYIDGKLCANGAIDDINSILSNIEHFEVGGEVKSYFNYSESEKATNLRGRYFGNVDELKIYNKALNNEQVKNLYNAGINCDISDDLESMKSEINRLISIIPTEQGKYSDQTWNELVKAVENGNGVLNTIGADKESLEDAIENIKTALDNLVEKQSKPQSTGSKPGYTLENITGKDKVIGDEDAAKPGIVPIKSQPEVDTVIKPIVNPFVDINGNVYYDSIINAYSMGYMLGVAEGYFDPSGNITRAMAVQILYNKAGKPAVSGISSFLDVTSDKWYSKSIIWAENNNIINGYGNGYFGPDDILTKEQLGIMLEIDVEGNEFATREWVAYMITK